MFSYKYTTIKRRGHKITMLKEDYNYLTDQGYYIILTKSNGKPSSVQLMKDKQYCGTLKSYYEATDFKDSNVCNFKMSNLIRK